MSQQIKRRHANKEESSAAASAASTAEEAVEDHEEDAEEGLRSKYISDFPVTFSYFLSSLLS